MHAGPVTAVPSPPASPSILSFTLSSPPKEQEREANGPQQRSHTRSPVMAKEILDVEALERHARRTHVLQHGILGCRSVQGEGANGGWKMFKISLFLACCLFWFCNTTPLLHSPSTSMLVNWRFCRDTVRSCAKSVGGSLVNREHAHRRSVRHLGKWWIFKNRSTK